MISFTIISNRRTSAFFLNVRLVLAVGALAIAGASDAQTDSGFIRVSAKNPRYLSYADGQAFIPVGPNICWPRFESAEEAVLAKMKMYLDSLAANGGNYTRIWLSAPQFQVEHDRAGEFDERLAARLDKVLDMARRKNIKVKLCFENFRTLTDYPARFKGSVPFDRPVYHTGNGGPLGDVTAFFNTADGHRLFLNRLSFFSDRYKEDPTVFGWELWNEVNAVRVEPELLAGWTVKMLDAANELFPNHLVMQSLGSFDQAGDSAIYRRYTRMRRNEIAQVHRYLDQGAGLEVCKGPMDILAASAVRELLAYDNTKPVILSEVGAVEPKHAGPSTLYDTDTIGVILHDLLFAPFFAGSAGPGQSWHWYEYIEKNNLWYHYKRFRAAIAGIDPVSEDVKPFFLEQNGVRLYGLDGRNVMMIWCRDGTASWQSELVDHVRPTVRRGVRLTVPGLHAASATAYDPWADRTVNAAVNKESTVVLPPFSRSIVVRITKKETR